MASRHAREGDPGCQPLRDPQHFGDARHTYEGLRPQDGRPIKNLQSRDFQPRSRPSHGSPYPPFIPLLAEKENFPGIDRVLVVDVEPEIQVSRLIDRDSCSREQAKQALAAQASRAQRLKLADDVLDNSSSPLDARKLVAQLHSKYMQLAEGS